MNQEMEDAAREFENRVYAIAAPYFEELEHAKKIHGNGHHMAQKLAARAADMVRERWNK